MRGRGKEKLRDAAPGQAEPNPCSSASASRDSPPHAKCSFLCVALPFHGVPTPDTGTNPTASPSQDVLDRAWTALYSLASPLLSNDQSQEVICWLLGRKMLGFLFSPLVSSTDHFCLRRKPLETDTRTHTYFPKAPAPRKEHPRAAPTSCSFHCSVMRPQGRSQMRAQMWGIRE